MHQGLKGGCAFPYYDIWIDPFTIEKLDRTKLKSRGKPSERFERVGPPVVRACDLQGTS